MASRVQALHWADSISNVTANAKHPMRRSAIQRALNNAGSERDRATIAGQIDRDLRLMVERKHLTKPRRGVYMVSRPD